jgi:DHA1 family tetracycline resistance protein-like MFS transporter
MARRSKSEVREPLPRGFWIIWSTVALDMIGFGIIVPILGRYADRFGASGLQVGLLFASFSVAQMIFSPIFGRWSDRIGRKPVLIVSLFGSAIGSFVLAAAGSLWMLFIGRVIDGASGASVSVAQGAVTDIAPPAQRARMIGLLSMAFGVGFIVGPAIGGLAALGGPHVPFIVAGMLALSNAIAAIFRLPETRRSDAPRRERTKRFARGWLTVYVAVGFLTMLPFAGFEATFAIFGKARFALDEASTAAVFLFVGLLTAAVHGGLVGPLTSRFGSARLLRVGLACIAAGLLALSSAVVWPVLLVALALMVVGSGLSTPSLTTLVVDSTDDARRGEVLGVQQSANAFARTIGPPFAGLAFDVIGVGAPFALGAMVAAVALLTVVTRIHVD